MYQRYCVYQGFGQVYLGYDGLILCSSQFQVMTEPPQKLSLTLKVVKSDRKIIISLLLSRLSLNPSGKGKQDKKSTVEVYDDIRGQFH